MFLMDEPLSNLDAKLRVQTRAEIARLHQRLKTTIVYVTHDQVEAMTMGNRIAVMSEGRLQQVGTPQELYDYPVNRFVAGFIGSPSMNFIDVDAAGHRWHGAACGPGHHDSRPGPVPRDGRVGGPAPSSRASGRSTSSSARRRTAPRATVDGVAEVVEYLGNEELLHVTMNDRDLVAIVDSSQQVQPGQNVTLHVPLEKVYLFDPESGLASGPASQPVAA